MIPYVLNANIMNVSTILAFDTPLCENFLAP